MMKYTKSDLVVGLCIIISTPPGYKIAVDHGEYISFQGVDDEGNPRSKVEDYKWSKDQVLEHLNRINDWKVITTKLQYDEIY